MKKVLWLVSLMLIVSGPLAGQDCDVTNDVDGNGVFEFSDAKYLFVYLFDGGAAPICPDQTDANGDGSVNIADVAVMANLTAACEAARVGDVNGSGIIAMADVDAMLEYLFLGGPAPVPCLDVADVNGDGSVSLADAAVLAANLPCPPEVPGDVNGDERLDIADLIIVAESFTTDVTFVPCDLAGDLNGDGQFGVADLIAYFELF